MKFYIKKATPEVIQELKANYCYAYEFAVYDAPDGKLIGGVGYNRHRWQFYLQILRKYKAQYENRKFRVIEVNGRHLNRQEIQDAVEKNGYFCHDTEISRVNNKYSADAKPSAYKFQKLKDFFSTQTVARIEMTFEQIERILGFPLERSAYEYPTYWHYTKTHTIAKAWMEYGYEPESISQCKERKMTFLRNSETRKPHLIKISESGITAARLEVQKQDKKEIESDAVFVQEVNDAPEPQMQTSFLPISKGIPSGSLLLSYVRNPSMARAALKEAGYICELCGTERLFKKDNGQWYVEAHHLIPMKIEDTDTFQKSIDHPANIISLCSYHHNLLHYGKLEEKKPLLEKLHQKRMDKLIEGEIFLDFIELIKVYQ